MSLNFNRLVMLVALLLSAISCAAEHSQRSASPDGAAATVPVSSEQRVRALFERLEEMGVITGQCVAAANPWMRGSQPLTVLAVGDYHKAFWEEKNRKLILQLAAEFGIRTLFVEGLVPNGVGPRLHDLMAQFNAVAAQRVMSAELRTTFALTSDVKPVTEPMYYHTLPLNIVAAEGHNPEDQYFVALRIFQMDGLSYFQSMLNGPGTRVMLQVDGKYTTPAISRFFLAQEILSQRFGSAVPMLSQVLQGETTDPEGKAHTVQFLDYETHRDKVDELSNISMGFLAVNELRDRNFRTAYRIWEYLRVNPKEDLVLVVIGLAHLYSKEGGIPSLQNALASRGISTVVAVAAPIDVGYSEEHGFYIVQPK